MRPSKRIGAKEIEEAIFACVTIKITDYFFYLMSRITCNIFLKIVTLFLLSLILSLPLPVHASNKTLVLFPLVIYADQSRPYLRQGAQSMLTSRLSGGGILLISDERLLSLLSEKEKEGLSDRRRAEELARRLEADYAIFGSVTTIGGGYSLDLSLLELEKNGSGLTRVSKTGDENQFISQLADVAYQLRGIIEGKEKPGKKTEERAAITPKPQTGKGLFSRLERDKEVPEAIEKGLSFKSTRQYRGLNPTGEISIDMTVMAFDMGDLDGNGDAEVLVLGRKKLLVYQREGESFVFRDSLKPSFGEEFLKVSVGDIDSNGSAEIYLVTRYGIRARTSVCEWNGGFKRLYRWTGHLQVVRDPGGGKPLLLFQGSKVDEFFSGSIYLMNYDKEGKLTKGEPLPKLTGVQFNTLALFDLDKDGYPEFLGLGEDSRIRVWDRQGNILWKGDKTLGGTNNAIRLGEREAPGALLPRISFNSRLLTIDIDGDGKNEILAINNISLIEHLLNFRVFKRSRLIAYMTEGTDLFPAWTTGEIDYCLTDMQVDGRSLFLAAHKGKISNVGKGSSRIMWFE